MEEDTGRGDNPPPHRTTGEAIGLHSATLPDELDDRDGTAARGGGMGTQTTMGGGGHGGDNAAMHHEIDLELLDLSEDELNELFSVAVKEAEEDDVFHYLNSSTGMSTSLPPANVVASVAAANGSSVPLQSQQHPSSSTTKSVSNPRSQRRKHEETMMMMTTTAQASIVEPSPHRTMSTLDHANRGTPLPAIQNLSLRDNAFDTDVRDLLSYMGTLGGAHPGNGDAAAALGTFSSEEDEDRASLAALNVGAFPFPPPPPPPPPTTSSALPSSSSDQPKQKPPRKPYTRRVPLNNATGATSTSSETATTPTKRKYVRKKSPTSSPVPSSTNLPNQTSDSRGGDALSRSATKGEDDAEDDADEEEDDEEEEEEDDDGDDEDGTEGDDDDATAMEGEEVKRSGRGRKKKAASSTTALVEETPESREERVRVKREKNKQAARNSRKKKKEYDESLSREVTALSATLDAMREASLVRAREMSRRRRVALCGARAFREAMTYNGPNAESRQELVHYEISSLARTIAPPHTRFLLWAAARRATEDVGSAAGVAWNEVVTKVLKVGNEQRARLDALLRAKTVTSDAAVGERERLTMISKCLGEVKVGTLNVMKDLDDAYRELFEEILTPEQTAKLMAWTEANRERVAETGLLDAVALTYDLGGGATQPSGESTNASTNSLPTRRKVLEETRSVLLGGAPIVSSKNNNNTASSSASRELRALIACMNL